MDEEPQGYRKLRAWQLGMALAKEVYELTKQMPIEERYGLTAQIRSSATSIPSNIAEGYGRGGRGDYTNFVGYSLGSLFELETRLLLAESFNYLDAGPVLLR